MERDESSHLELRLSDGRWMIPTIFYLTAFFSFYALFLPYLPLKINAVAWIIPLELDYHEVLLGSLWQLVSHFFLLYSPSPISPLSLSTTLGFFSLMILLCQLYFLSHLFKVAVNYLGSKKTAFIYLGVGVGSGTMLVVLNLFFNSNFKYHGNLYPFFSLLLILGMIFKNQTVQLFSSFFPFSRVILSLVFLQSAILILSNQWSQLVILLATLYMTHMYAYSSMGLPKLFNFSVNFPYNLIASVNFKRNKFEVYDLDMKKNIVIYDQEELLDRLLDKISKHGRSSLSRKEKRYLNHITEEKRSNHNP